jgi:hypothetical protein
MFNDSHPRLSSLGVLMPREGLLPMYLPPDEIVQVDDVHLGKTFIWTGLKGTLFVDIDGTVADLSHRRIYLQSHPKNYPAFEKGIPLDTPIPHIIEAVSRLYKADWKIVMCSGRSENTRSATEAWLEKHGVRYSALYMRKAFEVDAEGNPVIARSGRMKPDHRRDNIVKYELLLEACADGFAPDIVFDDRDQVVEMWRANGIAVVQVAEGDF